MMDWIVEVEDIACAVDDMSKMGCSRCCVLREWNEGKGER